jgi:hypothetical protein
MHFLSFSKKPNTNEDVVCKKVPGGFDSLHIRPRFALRPPEGFGILQCGPRGERPARLAGIRWARPRPRPGKGDGRVPTPQGVDFGARSGRGEGRRGGLPAAGGRRRWPPWAMLRCGSGSDWARRATSSCPRGSRLGLCAALGRCWLGKGSSLWRCPWRTVARGVRGDGRQPLYSRGGSCLSVEGTPP